MSRELTGWTARGAGLATGIVFGALLERGGLSRSSTIIAQLEGRSMRVATTMGAAVLVGMAASELLRKQDRLTPEIKPLRLGSVVPGAAVFGAGMAIGGYCPGTALAGAGAGRSDARWALLGMAAGALAFVRLAPMLDLMLKSGDLGRRRIGP